MKTYGGVDALTHILLPSALDAANSQLHAKAVVPSGKQPRYSLDTRLGGPQNRFGLHGEVNIFTTPELELRSLGRPHRSQSLSKMRYPGS
jgi:hypothetical protein